MLNISALDRAKAAFSQLKGNVQNWQAQNRQKVANINQQYRVPTKIADPILGFGTGLAQGLGGFTGIENKPFGPLYQPKTTIGKVAQFAGAIPGFALGPGKLIAPLEAGIASRVAPLLPKALPVSAPIASRIGNTLIRRATPAIAAEAVSSLPLSFIQSKVQNQPLGQAYAQNVAMGLAARGTGALVGEGFKVGKQALGQGKQATDMTIKKSYLTQALQHETGLERANGTQIRQVGTEQFGKKINLTKEVGGQTVGNEVSQFFVKVAGKLGRIKMTAREILDQKIPLDNVIGPANDVAKGFSRKAYSGGFIDLGSAVYGKDAIPKELQPLAEEARKYKTVEEFIKAQGNPILHGSEAKFDNFDLSKRGMNEQDFQSKNAFFFTDSIDTAKSYGKNVQERYGKFKNPLTIDAKGEMYSGGSSSVDMKQVLRDAVEKAKKEGNDVVIVKNLSDRKDWGNYEPATHYAVLDINKLQTKQQLTDLFNKAKQQNPQGGFADFGAKIDRTKLSGIQLDKPNAQLQPLRTAIPDAIQQVEKEILPKANIPPQNKVNIVDYFRTPINVLRKVGLGKEGELLKQKYDDYLDELPKEINKVTEWSKRAPAPDASQRIFKYLDGQDAIPLNPQEKQVATEIQGYLKNWADRLGLPKDQRVTNYITHLFDEELLKKEFDPDIAKLIADQVPGSVYDPFLQKRYGIAGYKEDAWQALDAYVKRGVRKFHMDQALGPLRNASEKLDLESQKYVQRLGERVNLRPSEFDSLLDNFIKTSPVGYKFGQRPTSVITKKLRQAVYRGTLGLNVGSAMRNLTQGANTYAELGEKYTMKGYMDVFRNTLSKSDELERVGVLRDDMIQDRTINATKKMWEKIDKGLFVFFEAAEKINRGAAYYGAKSKYLSQGLPEEEAIKKAVQLVEKTQFRFGSVDTPVSGVLSSDIGKFLTQFQSYGAKQAEFLGGKIANKEFSGLIRYVGANAAMVATMGKLFGMKPQDMIPFYSTFTKGEVPIPPSIQFAQEGLSALTNQPSDYGQERTTAQKLQDVGKSALPFIPASSQLKKTVEGVRAVSQGYSPSATGRVQYAVPQNAQTAVRAGVFGKNNLPEAREYFEKKPGVLGEIQTERVQKSTDKQGTYKQIIKDREISKKREEALDLLIEGKKEEAKRIRDEYGLVITKSDYDRRISSKKTEAINLLVDGDKEGAKKLAQQYKVKITNSDVKASVKRKVITLIKNGQKEEAKELARKFGVTVTNSDIK